MPKTVKNAPKSAPAGTASKVLGEPKARKFAMVEGLSLSERSLAASALTQGRGLTGDAYREAITGMFRDKRGK